MLIIPTYNERENIQHLVCRVRTSAPDEGICFIDDSSPDGTADEIRRIQEIDRNVHLLLRPGKQGYGSACREAMGKILRQKLDDHVIQFDADLSHPPERLPQMLQMLKTHDVVIGSRYVSGGGTRNWDMRRKALSFGGNLYARACSGVPVHDMTAGFVGYRAEVLRRLNLAGIESEGYAFLMEMKFNLHLIGARFGEFPIVFVEREAGKSKFSRRIMIEGMKFPLRAFCRRITGEGRAIRLSGRTKAVWTGK
jgi:dolichol-phosphate mannosyltransferase